MEEQDLVKKPAGEVVRYDRDFLLRFSQVHRVKLSLGLGAVPQARCMDCCTVLEAHC